MAVIVSVSVENIVVPSYHCPSSGKVHAHLPLTITALPLRVGGIHSALPTTAVESAVDLVELALLPQSRWPRTRATVQLCLLPVLLLLLPSPAACSTSLRDGRKRMARPAFAGAAPELLRRQAASCLSTVPAAADEGAIRALWSDHNRAPAWQLIRPGASAKNQEAQSRSRSMVRVSPVLITLTVYAEDPGWVGG